MLEDWRNKRRESWKIGMMESWERRRQNTEDRRQENETNNDGMLERWDTAQESNPVDPVHPVNRDLCDHCSLCERQVSFSQFVRCPWKSKIANQKSKMPYAPCSLLHALCFAHDGKGGVEPCTPLRNSEKNTEPS